MTDRTEIIDQLKWKWLDRKAKEIDDEMGEETKVDKTRDPKKQKAGRKGKRRSNKTFTPEGERRRKS